MIVPFSQIKFTNDVASIPYSENREAELTIVDESFKGSNTIGDVNVIICIVYQYDNNKNIIDRLHATNIIGMGDSVLGIRTENPQLLGMVLNKDNMAECFLELVE